MMVKCVTRKESGVTCGRASGDVGKSECEGLNVHEWKKAFGKERHFLRPGAWV